MNKKQKAALQKKKKIVSSVFVVVLVVFALFALFMIFKNRNDSSKNQDDVVKTSKNINVEEKLFYDCLYNQYNDKTFIDLRDTLNIAIITSSPDKDIELEMTNDLDCVTSYLDEWSELPEVMALTSINISVMFNGTGENNQSYVNKIVDLK